MIHEDITLGPVRLIRGDCTLIAPTLEGVDAVITDPPYGLNFPYNSYVDTRENLVALVSLVMPRLLLLSSNVYVLCGPTQIGLYPHPEWVSCVTWNTTGSFGKYGYNQWTPVLCYGKDLDGFGNVNGVTKSDTIRINGGGGVGFQRDDLEKQHTCPKPTSMMTMVVNRFSKPDQTILDPFMGSGTTLIAAIRTGRRAIGIEIDERHFRTAVERVKRELAQPMLPAMTPQKVEQQDLIA